MLVTELLTFGGLSDAEIIAGKDGGGRSVKSISVLEVAESAISNWVIEDQLYITAFYAIRDDVEMQKVVIQTLKQSGCCGLVICHLGRVMKTIDASVLELCDALDFPLIRANPDVSYIDILNPILERLTQPDYLENERNAALINMLLDERGIPDILKEITYGAGHEISFFDLEANCLFSNKNDAEKEAEVTFLQAGGVSEGKANQTSRELSLSGTRKLMYYIKARGHCFGIMLINFGQGDSPADLSALADNINLSCAPLFNRKQHIQNREDNQVAEFFTNLLIWNFRSKDAALSACRNFGFDFSRIHHLVVVNINEFQLKNDDEQTRKLTRYIKRWFLPNVVSIVRGYGAGSIVRFRSDIILVFLEDERRPGTLKKTACALLELFKGGKKTTVSIGTSNRFDTIEEIPRAYEEAFDAAIVGRRFCGVNKVVPYREVCAFRWVGQSKEQSSLKAEALDMLHPLAAHDEQKGTDLVRTVNVIFECGLDYSAAAERLFIHRNTLLYRKRQIRELLGYDPFAMPYLVSMALALSVAIPSTR